jgi:hypothetical protein
MNGASTVNLVRLCTALLVGLCATGVCHAQESCRGDESFNACFGRISGEVDAAAPDVATAVATEKVSAEQAAKEAVEKELAKAQTGADTGGTATAATLTDLAPFFDALGLLSTGDSADGTLALDLNMLIPVQQVENNNAQLKLILNTQPEPLDQLVQAFGETVRQERKDALQKDISTFGDAQLSFKWSLVNSHFGRDYRVLRPLIAPIHEGVVRTVRADAPKTATLKFLAVLTKLTQELKKADALRPAAAGPSSPNAPIESLPISDSLKSELAQATADAARERAAGTEAIQAELVRTRIDRLAELVEQQPQLLFSVSHDIRDEIVGPEKTSVTLTWEGSRANLSAFLGGDGADCAKKEVADGKDTYKLCVSELQKYIGDDALYLKQQFRWKLSASFQRVQKLTLRYPDDAVELNLPKTDRFEVAFGLGRALGTVANSDRIDFELAYDSNLDNDTTNKERVKATLTYLRRIGDTDMPFSIVYANKNEFLGEVDHQISLHLGLKFRQPKS